MTESPRLRYLRSRFLRDRIDRDAPLVAARLYKGGRRVVLAQRERPMNYQGPVETIPITMSELRRQIDIDRGYAVSPDDQPSVLGISRVIEQSPAYISQTIQPDQASYQLKPGASMSKTIQQPGVSPSKVKLQPGPPDAPRNRRLDVPGVLLPVTTLRGLGAYEGEQTVAAATVVVLALAVGGGYFAGAAMAPTPSDRVGYGVLGSLLGLFTGPIGLGAMGLVALSRK